MTDHLTDAVLDAYLAGTLDELACERLERHAAECVACGTRLEAATRLPGLEALPRDIPPPPGRREAVLDAVARRRGRRRALRWAGAVAAGLALVLAGALSRPPVKEAATRPRLGPPIALDTAVALDGRRTVQVAAAIGTLVVCGEGTTDTITLRGVRDDRTEVTVARDDEALWLGVAPLGGARWPAEVHATLTVPRGTIVRVAGRGVVVRDLGGTGGINIIGRGELHVGPPRGIEGSDAPIP